MAKYKVDITGINTSEIEVLSNEEMTKLFVEYQNGNWDAKERLINGNLKLVLSILRSFNKGNVNLDDAINKYTEAMKLAKYCGEKLNDATKKVNKILTEDNELKEFNAE